MFIFNLKPFLKSIRWLTVFISTAVFVVPVSGFAQRASKPNIVFFYADDLGWRDVGFNGSDFYETPHVDRLASQGMVFTNAYANAPNCAPSRACLMTGQYTPRHGIFTVGDPARGNDAFRKLTPVPNRTVLPDSFTTLPEVLSSAGYRTAIFGKWHLGPDPGTQGFQHAVSRQTVGIPRGYLANTPDTENADSDEPKYLTERFSRAACDYIDAHQTEPFFVYFAMHVVHTPIEGKPSLVRKYQRKLKGENHNNPEYAAMVQSMDSAVGEVLSKLEELALTDNTIVIFYSDNGGYGPATSMSPLRGSKGMLYEGGIRVPLVIKWTGHISAGAICDVPVIGIDLFPTLLELTETEHAPGLEFDGQSLAGLLTGADSLADRALYWHFPAYLESYRRVLGPFRTTPAGAIRMGQWKLVEFFENRDVELYDLAADISEQINLADMEPEITEQMLSRLQAWQQKTEAPIPTTKNPSYDPEARWPWRNP